MATVGQSHLYTFIDCSGTHVYHIEWTTEVSSLDANQAGDLAVEDMHGGTSGQASSQWLR